jgi:arylsulfatase A-like enzyme
LFEYLNEAGYFTGLCGKWHIGQPHLPPRGAGYHFGLPGWQGIHNHKYTYIKNGQEITLNGNKSAFITDAALEFLDQVPEGKPFFLNIGYIATHSPYKQQTHDPQLTALYQATSFSHIPPYQPHPWVKNEGISNAPTKQELRDRYIGYYAATTEIDRNVKHIVDKLVEMEELDNTIIIYTADHGCAIGHHGFFGKGNSTRPLNMYEHSLRIPLICSGPGIKSGQVVERCVDHYDGFKTILDLAGITPEMGRSYPGTAYTAQLRGEDMVWDDTRYGEYGDLRMIRTRQWKLVYRYPNGPHDLFDLANDPGETRNLIDDPGQRQIVANLKQQLETFYADYEDTEKSGLRVKELPRHNSRYEAWRDGLRESQGLQVY